MRLFVTTILLLCALDCAADVQYSATVGSGYQALTGATIKGKVSVRTNPCQLGNWTLDGVMKNAEGGCPSDYLGDNLLWDTTTTTDGSHTLKVGGLTAVFTVANAAAAAVCPAAPAQVRDMACPSGGGTWSQHQSCSCPTGGSTWTCGAWTPAAQTTDDCPAAPPPDPSVALSFTADRHYIYAGESATITWTADRGACVASFTNPVGLTGTATVTPGATTQYDMTCTAGRSIAHSSFVINVSAAPPPVSKAWPCQPLPANVALRTTDDGHLCAVGFCQAATGWFKADYCGDPIQAADLTALAQVMLLTSSPEAIFNANNARAQTDSEKATVDIIVAATGPRYVVQAIAAGTRPVYTENADGSRGAQLVLTGVPQRVAVASRCNPYRRITAAAYYSVQGVVSATGQALPANAFAQCVKQ